MEPHQYVGPGRFSHSQQRLCIGPILVPCSHPASRIVKGEPGISPEGINFTNRIFTGNRKLIWEPRHAAFATLTPGFMENRETRFAAGLCQYFGSQGEPLS